MCVRVTVSARMFVCLRACVYACVRDTDRNRERACVCVKQTQCVCVCVCVCVCKRECVRVYVSVRLGKVNRPLAETHETVGGEDSITLPLHLYPANGQDESHKALAYALLHTVVGSSTMNFSLSLFPCLLFLHSSPLLLYFALPFFCFISFHVFLFSLCSSLLTNIA